MPEKDESDGKVVDPIRRLRTYLKIQNETINILISMLLNELNNNRKGDEVLRVTLMMIQAYGVTASTIINLTEKKDMSIRDCYAMARSAFELALNICYIVAVGPEAALQADRHAMQKSFRDLRRTSEAGGFRMAISRERVPELSEIPGLSEAIEEYTHKNGREDTAWIKSSVTDRISKVSSVCESAGLSLFGAFPIYRHASEFIHGTYFSVIYFWRDGGFDDYNKNGIKEKWDENWNNHFLSIFSTIYFSTRAMTECYSKIMKIPEIEKLCESNVSLGVLILELVEGPLGAKKY